MVNRLHQLNKFHEFLKQEFAQLQNNIKCYLEVCHGAMLCLNDKKDVYCRSSLNACDNLIVNITNVMTLIRKFNLQMTLHWPQDFRNTTSLKDLEIMHTIESENLLDFNVPFDNITQKKEMLQSVSNGSDKMISTSTDHEDLIFSRMNLINIYKADTILNVKITFVNDEKQMFYIHANSEQEKTLRDLENSVNLCQYLLLPPESTIFGLNYNDRIVRAVRASSSLCDDGMQENFWHCYLIDFGEIVQLRLKDRTYKLTWEQLQLPAQAIECRLKDVENLAFSIQYLKEKYLKHEQVMVKVIEVNENYLGVSIMDQDVSRPIDVDQYNLNSLNEAEVEELYEEPFCTTNIMKAVMGHDPQDEKRICRFYNPKTGNCFKGARCRQEHTLLQPEGWTKDLIPDNSLVRKCNPDIIYEEGEIINITPTCVTEVGMFYCQINNPEETVEPLIWREDKVSKWQMSEKPPLLYQLVLCRYLDGYWYRAQIISHDNNSKMFKVFYVDYGNTDIVHIREIAKCDNNAIHLPYRATLCRVNGAPIAVSISEEKRQKCINLMTEMIINKDLNAEVCSHMEILTITFVDEPSIMNLVIKKVGE